MKKYLLVVLCFGFLACKNDPKKEMSALLSSGDTLAIDYAEGFEIVEYEDFKLMTIKNPWPNGGEKFVYLLSEAEKNIPEGLEYDAKIEIPVDEIVVTSTTHIPSLETLGVQNTLKGFPTLGYISSVKTRDLIDAGKIKELGTNQDINTEVLLEIRPDVVVGFAISGGNKSFNIIEKNGIPVIYNGDWTEKDPLGKAEWIKFFGALYNKLPEATAAFEKVEKLYVDSKALVENIAEKPRVLSGAMYRDSWYLPYGDSWQANFIKDAGGKYIYEKTQGNGSIALSFEKVFEDGQNADIWIAPGNFTSYAQLLNNSGHYGKFKAFQNKEIYGYADVLGETGGAIYYEFAPNRPDLVLRDLIKLFHPELLPEYELTFFKPLD